MEFNSKEEIENLSPNTETTVKSNEKLRIGPEALRIDLSFQNEKCGIGSGYPTDNNFESRERRNRTERLNERNQRNRRGANYETGSFTNSTESCSLVTPFSSPAKSPSVPSFYSAARAIGNLDLESPMHLEGLDLESKNKFSQNKRTKICLQDETLQEPSPRPNFLLGIENEGATCYLNSLIQSLFHLESLRSKVLSWNHCEAKELANLFHPDDVELSLAEYEFFSENSLPLQLQNIFMDLLYGNFTDSREGNYPLSLTPLFKTFGWEASQCLQQHDVQEMKNILLDEFSKDQDQNVRSWEKDFQGETENYICCLSCKKRSVKTESFLDVGLALSEFGSKKCHNSIQVCLQKYFEPEKLTGENQYYCDSCQSKVDAVKGCTFKRFPNYLVLHLKRFNYDYSKNIRVKTTSPCAIPMKLTAEDLVHRDELEQNFETLKEMSFLLTSIILHQGDANCGHYRSLCKTSQGWVEFNDTRVTKYTTSEVDIFLKNRENSEAYLLIYEKNAWQQTLNMSIPAYQHLRHRYLKSRISEETYPGVVVLDRKVCRKKAPENLVLSVEFPTQNVDSSHIFQMIKESVSVRDLARLQIYAFLENEQELISLENYSQPDFPGTFFITRKVAYQLMQIRIFVIDDDNPAELLPLPYNYDFRLYGRLPKASDFNQSPNKNYILCKLPLCFNSDFVPRITNLKTKIDKEFKIPRERISLSFLRNNTLNEVSTDFILQDKMTFVIKLHDNTLQEQGVLEGWNPKMNIPAVKGRNLKQMEAMEKTETKSLLSPEGSVNVDFAILDKQKGLTTYHSSVLAPGFLWKNLLFEALNQPVLSSAAVDEVNVTLVNDYKRRGVDYGLLMSMTWDTVSLKTKTGSKKFLKRSISEYPFKAKVDALVIVSMNYKEVLSARGKTTFIERTERKDASSRFF
eukprot:snap_masked-scaffold_54-processed-gene-1.31-mRNA-1 protein AED:1.00 eAED:1.00 QI:0/-1/0/0/-1/1/1/0/914